MNPLASEHDSSPASTEPAAKRVVPSLAEIDSNLRRAGRHEPFAGFLHHVLLAIETRLTRLLMLLGVGSRAVTIIWVILLLAAYGIMLIGTAWGFVLGSLLVYLFLLLDWCDGEIGRFEKQFMTPEENQRTFINGLYLDRVAHGLTSPLWGIALGVGLYRCTGDQFTLIAAVTMAMFWGTRQTVGLTRSYLDERFLESVREAVAHGEFEEFRKEVAPRDGIIVRLLDYLEWRLGNVKTVNLLILVCGLLDLGLLIFGGISTCPALHFTFLALGCLAPVLSFHLLFSPIRRNLALQDMIDNLPAGVEAKLQDEQHAS